MSNAKIIKPWEVYPQLDHLTGPAREMLESRKRHRQVRYLLFSLQTAIGNGKSLNTVACPDGFVEFWLKEKPTYQIDPTGRKTTVTDQHKKKNVEDLGGYALFATKWDVDADLQVYIRHSSVWQEWNSTLMRVVPVLGE